MSIAHQCRRLHVWLHASKVDGVAWGQRVLESASTTSFHLQNRHHPLSIRRSVVQNEVRLVDLWQLPSEHFQKVFLWCLAPSASIATSIRNISSWQTWRRGLVQLCSKWRLGPYSNRRRTKSSWIDLLIDLVFKDIQIIRIKAQWQNFSLIPKTLSLIEGNINDIFRA